MPQVYSTAIEEIFERWDGVFSLSEDNEKWKKALTIFPADERASIYYVLQHGAHDNILARAFLMTMVPNLRMVKFWGTKVEHYPYMPNPVELAILRNRLKGQLLEFAYDVVGTMASITDSPRLADEYDEIIIMLLHGPVTETKLALIKHLSVAGRTQPHADRFAKLMQSDIDVPIKMLLDEKMQQSIEASDTNALFANYIYTVLQKVLKTSILYSTDFLRDQIEYIARRFEQLTEGQIVADQHTPWDTTHGGLTSVFAMIHGDRYKDLRHQISRRVALFTSDLVITEGSSYEVARMILDEFGEIDPEIQASLGPKYQEVTDRLIAAQQVRVQQEQRRIAIMRELQTW